MRWLLSTLRLYCKHLSFSFSRTFEIWLEDMLQDQQSTNWMVGHHIVPTAMKGTSVLYVPCVDVVVAAVSYDTTPAQGTVGPYSQLSFIILPGDPPTVSSMLGSGLCPSER